jgi:hypothetical protein
MLMSHRRFFRALAFFATLAGCGLDLAGQQFVRVADTPSGGALNPPRVGAADAGSPAALDGDLTEAEAAFGPDADLVEEGAASLDGGSPALDGAPTDADLPEATAVKDGATKDSAPDGADDGGPPCERLMLCCNQLVPPIPITVLACIATAQQADSGDAGACESLFANLHGAGACP